MSVFNSLQHVHQSHILLRCSYQSLMSSLHSCNIFQTAVAKANHFSTCHQNWLDIITVIAVRMHDLSSSHAILPPWNQRLTSPLTPAVVGSRLSDWDAGRTHTNKKYEPAEPHGADPVYNHSKTSSSSFGSLKYRPRSIESEQACIQIRFITVLMFGEGEGGETAPCWQPISFYPQVWLSQRASVYFGRYCSVCLMN